MQRIWNAAVSQTSGHVSTKHSTCKYKLIPSGLLYSMLVVVDSWKQFSLNSEINFGGNKMVTSHPGEQQERYYIKGAKIFFGMVKRENWVGQHIYTKFHHTVASAIMFCTVYFLHKLFCCFSICLHINVLFIMFNLCIQQIIIKTNCTMQTNSLHICM